MGRCRQDYPIWSIHLLTPETDHKNNCHYGYARNFDLYTKALTKTLYKGLRDTLQGDVETIDVQQEQYFELFFGRPSRHQRRR